MIKISHLSKKFGNLEVLKDINLDIEEGEVVCIIGPSGSGKSTFLRCINQLESPSGGIVEYEGKNLLDKKCDIRKFREEVGMVFQNPDNQQVASIVEDDIAFGPENIGMPREKTGERIDYVLKVTDMEKYRNVEVARLSGGQKQRLSIARVILKKPSLYIYDDSFSALDFKTDATLRKALKPEVKDAIFFVVAQRISTIMDSDMIIVLDEGQIIGMGTHTQLLKDCRVYQEIAHSQLTQKELDDYERN